MSPRFGCYGDRLARTPNIDRLAAQGCRFPAAFSTAAVCSPSRCAVITGMYATAIGAHHHRTSTLRPDVPELPTPYAPVPPPYVKTISEYLRAAGYYCTNNHKTDYQFRPPCTTWDRCDREAHWRQRPAGAPFFAVFNEGVTHESGMFASGSTPQTDPDRVELPPYLPDTPKVRRALALHYDHLAAADRRVGELLDQLAEDGLSDDTLVVLWSDHGEGLPRGKSWLYDSGIRVPLIARWPGRLSAGGVDGRLVSMIDLGPAALVAAGIEPPRHLQGQSFLGGTAARRSHVFAARDRHDEMYDMVRAVRDERFKYIRNFHPELPYLLWNAYRNRHPAMQELWRLRAEGALGGGAAALFAGGRPPEELYDTAADPHEVRNLAGDPEHRPTLERLREALGRWRVDCGDLGDEPEAHLAARMWPGGIEPRTAPPRFIPTGSGLPGLHAVEGMVPELPGPALLVLYSATQGASIEYTFASGAHPVWTLYTGPIPLPPGRHTVRARAGRIGYQDSTEAVAVLRVEAGKS